MNAALEIQKAAFDALRQHNVLTSLLGGDHIYDDLPASKKPPYVLFGTIESFDWSTSTEGGEEHFLELEIWSAQNGRKQVIQIVDAVRSALASLGDAAPVVLGEHQPINLAVETTLTKRTEKNQFFQTILTIRAVSEPTLI